MITINLFLMPLNKIVDIKYTYGSLNQLREKYLFEGKHIFIPQRMVERGGVFRAKVISTRSQK